MMGPWTPLRRPTEATTGFLSHALPSLRLRSWGLNVLACVAAGAARAVLAPTLAPAESRRRGCWISPCRQLSRESDLEVGDGSGDAIGAGMQIPDQRKLGAIRQVRRGCDQPPRCFGEATTQGDPELHAYGALFHNSELDCICKAGSHRLHHPGKLSMLVLQTV